MTATDLNIAFPVIEGEQESLVWIAKKSYDGDNYRQDLRYGNIHFGFNGSGFEFKRWAESLSSYCSPQNAFELSYSPVKNFSGQSFGLAAAVAWLRASHGRTESMQYIIASGELGTQGSVLPVDKDSFKQKIEAVLDYAEQNRNTVDVFLYSNKQQLDNSSKQLLEEMQSFHITAQAIASLDDCQEYWQTVKITHTTKKEKSIMSLTTIGSLAAVILSGTFVMSSDWDLSPVQQQWQSPQEQLPSITDNSDLDITPSPVRVLPPPMQIADNQTTYNTTADTNTETACVTATDQPDMDRLDAELDAQAKWGKRSGFKISSISHSSQSREGRKSERTIERSAQGTLQGITTYKVEKRNNEWCVTVGPI